LCADIVVRIGMRPASKH